MKQRNVAYDLMKGIALILMMLCHLVYTDGPVKQFIDSFHMPLFFILAGIFAKSLEDIPSFRDYTRKNAKRLLLPYVVTYLILCAWGGILTIAKHDVAIFLRHLFSMLTASADGWDTKWGLVYAGPMWFLVALFWVRELFYGILHACACVDRYSDELVVGMSILLSLLAVQIHPYLPSLPFSFIQALAALGFYAVGWYIHNHSMPWWVYAICVLVWPIAILYGDIELESATIAYFPLSFVGACGGTFIVYTVCRGWNKVLLSIKSLGVDIQSPLAWCGLYSLSILCMHELEKYSDVMYSILCRLPQVSAIIGWGEVFIAIIMAYILLKIPYIKDIYK